MNPLQEYIHEYKMPPQLPYEQFNKISSAITSQAEDRFGAYAAEVVECLQPGLTKAASADHRSIARQFDEIERRVNLNLAMMCKAAGVSYDRIKYLPFAEKVAAGQTLLKPGGKGVLKGVGNFFNKLIGRGGKVELPKVLGPGPSEMGGSVAKTVAKTPAKETAKQVAQVASKPKAPTTASPVKVQQTPGQTASTGKAEVSKSIQGQSQAAASAPAAGQDTGQLVVRNTTTPGTGPGFRDSGIVRPNVSAGAMKVNPQVSSAETFAPTKTMVSKGPAAKPSPASTTAPAQAQAAPTTAPTAAPAAQPQVAQAVHPDPKVNAIVAENPELAKLVQPGSAASPTQILQASGGGLGAGQQHTLLSTHQANLQAQLSKGGLNAAEKKGIENAMAETGNMLKQLGSTGAPIQQGIFGGFGGYGATQGAGNIVKSLRWPAAGLGAVYLGSQAIGGGQHGYTPQGY